MTGREPSPLAVAFAGRAGLSPTPSRVLEAVARLADRTGPRWGETYARVSTIAGRAGVSERTAQRALAGLVEAGRVERVDRPGRTCWWRIVRPPEEPSRAPDRAADEGPVRVSGGVTDWRSGGDKLAPDQRLLPEQPQPTASQRLPLRRQPCRPDALEPVPPDLDRLRWALAGAGLGGVPGLLRPSQLPVVRAALGLLGPGRLARVAAGCAGSRGAPACWAAWVVPWTDAAWHAPHAAASAGRPPDPVPQVGRRLSSVELRALLAAHGVGRPPEPDASRLVSPAERAAREMHPAGRGRAQPDGRPGAGGGRVACPAR